MDELREDYIDKLSLQKGLAILNHKNQLVMPFCMLSI